jgi:hypothetical protein
MALLLFCVASTAQAYRQENLREGIPFTGKITNGEKQTFSLELEVNKTVTVQVYQKGLDVIVRAFVPDSSVIQFSKNACRLSQ